MVVDLPPLPPDLPPLFDEAGDKPNGGAKLSLVDPDYIPPEFIPDPPALLLNKNGRPFKTVANVITMLAEHPAWRGVLVWDEFAQTIRKLKPPPVLSADVGGKHIACGEWTDADTVRAQAWLQSQGADVEPPHHYHRIDASALMIESAILVVAERTRIHPVREWLRSLDWDGVQRIPDLFVQHFGAIDTTLNREIGKRWMISAVARVMQPGCQCKYMPVLESEQDAGKSTGIAALVGASPDGEAWFSDTPLRIGSGDKDAYQCLRAKWVHEWAELAAFRSARDVEGLKSFISSPTDNFRSSYGKRNRDFARQCVFIGTTNEERWLTDPTGGSRFWPMRGTSGVLVNRAAIAALRPQLWAEAVVRFDAGERWWIDPQTEPALLRSAREEQKERTEDDPWVDLVRAWLSDATLPDEDGSRRRIVPAQGLTSTEILLGACGMRRAEITRSAATRVGYVMRELGWSRARRLTHEDGDRQRLYFPPTEE